MFTYAAKLVTAVLLAAMLLALAACGNVDVSLEEPNPSVEPTGTSTARPATREPETVVTVGPRPGSSSTPVDIVAWYGTIHTVADAQDGSDFFKPWHLNLWPKFGSAVGIAGAGPAIRAEIDRLRDTDTKATIWGRLTCGVADYGACQLLVTALSASDGGPSYEPEQIEAWEGSIGRLPSQPGSERDSFYFVLSGERPVLYGITSPDPSIERALADLSESGALVHIWGVVRSRAAPVTGSVIEAEQLELVGSSS